jgi:hypothetical protein
MSTSTPSDHGRERKTSRHLCATRRRFGALLLALFFVAVPSLEVHANDARRAIEKLEGCSGKERAAGACIKILKRESAGKGKQRIKAQVRGGRIIWYEFDTNSGRVRRAN